MADTKHCKATTACNMCTSCKCTQVTEATLHIILTCLMFALMSCAGGHELLQQHPGHYAHLLAISEADVDMVIMRDLNRTFPNHVYFKQRQGQGQRALFQVLRAYASYDAKVSFAGCSCRCISLHCSWHGFACVDLLFGQVYLLWLSTVL